MISRIEPYYRTLLLSHKYDKLDKVRELFQVSRRQNHIAQQVTLCLLSQYNALRHHLFMTTTCGNQANNMAAK